MPESRSSSGRRRRSSTRSERSSCDGRRPLPRPLRFADAVLRGVAARRRSPRPGRLPLGAGCPSRGAPALSPILPDGCADIMVYDDAPPRVAGPDATTRWTQPSRRDGDRRPSPSARAPCARSSAATRAPSSTAAPGCRTSLPAPARCISGWMTPEPGRPHALLEDWVRTRSRARATADRAVVAACRMLTADPRLEIAAISPGGFGWNARTIHRQFRAPAATDRSTSSASCGSRSAIRAGTRRRRARLADLARRPAMPTRRT